eukprot:6184633-Pleurochrysis_carterae.AAC.1
MREESKESSGGSRNGEAERRDADDTRIGRIGKQLHKIEMKTCNPAVEQSRRNRTGKAFSRKNGRVDNRQSEKEGEREKGRSPAGLVCVFIQKRWQKALQGMKMARGRGAAGENKGEMERWWTGTAAIISKSSKGTRPFVHAKQGGRFPSNRLAARTPRRRRCEGR